MALLGLLAGCANDARISRVDPPLPMAPAAPLASASALLGQPTPAQKAPAQIFPGTGRFVEPIKTQAAQDLADGEPVDINFVNADIRSTLDAVLGGMLGLTYTIDPKVQGQVTIRSTRPLPRSQALAAVDAVLREQGFAIIASGGFYQVVPTPDAIGQAPLQTARAAERAAGFSIAIVPVRSVSIVDLDKVVRPLARQGFIQQADPARNMFIVSGNAHEIEAFTQLVASLDVDWLKGLSFSLYSLQSVEPARLESELRRTLQLDSGPLHGMIELIPIPRLNAMIVAAKNPTLITTVNDWIERLDRPGPDGGRLVHYYEVQNGSAAELANTLNKLAGHGDSGAAADQGHSTAKQKSSTAGGFSQPAGASSLPATGLASTSPTSPLAASISAGGGEGESGDGVSELRGVKVVADDRRNALLIFGTASQFSLIEEALSRLDSPREQVLIEATIAEVTLTDGLNFGVQWFLSKGNNNGGFATNSGTLAPSYPNFNYSFLTQNTQVALSALSSVTDVQVLSAPRLMVLNNETARLQVGDQVPIVVQQATSLLTSESALVNSVQYQDTGVILEVTPHINRNGVVVLEVSQEVSTVATTTTSNIDSPTIQQRKINSIVNVQDGETVALGGLISDTVNRSGQGIPYLRDIPVLGYLFGTDTRSKERTELLVFLRPVIVRDATRAREVTEALRARMGRLEALTHVDGPQ